VTFGSIGGGTALIFLYGVSACNSGKKENWDDEAPLTTFSVCDMSVALVEVGSGSDISAITHPREFKRMGGIVVEFPLRTPKLLPMEIAVPRIIKDTPIGIITWRNEELIIKLPCIA